MFLIFEENIKIKFRNIYEEEITSDWPLQFNICDDVFL